MNFYNVALLNSEKTVEAEKINDQIFSGEVYGVRVAVPELAARCEGNLDPQHADDKHYVAVITEALTTTLPPVGTVLVTTQADLYSLSAMAILVLRAEGISMSENMLERVRKIAAADTFVNGPWTGPRELPTKENRWPEGDDMCKLAPIAARAGDCDFPISRRFEDVYDWIALDSMDAWLVFSSHMSMYIVRAQQERDELIQALTDGHINVSIAAYGKIAVVESGHRAAVAIGYAKAPVVVALNPKFQIANGRPHRKFTICVHSAKHANIGDALADLEELENGWSGSPTMGESPRGINSKLTVRRVTEVVARHLR